MVKKICSIICSLLMVVNPVLGEWKVGPKSDSDITITSGQVSDFDSATTAVGDTNYLKLDTSNDPLTAALDVKGMISSYGPGLGSTKYIGIFHDDTDGTLGTNQGQLKFSPVTNIISLLPDASGTYKHIFADSGVNTMASIDSN